MTSEQLEPIESGPMDTDPEQGSRDRAAWGAKLKYGCTGPRSGLRLWGVCQREDGKPNFGLALTRENLDFLEATCGPLTFETDFGTVELFFGESEGIAVSAFQVKRLDREPGKVGNGNG